MYSNYRCSKKNPKVSFNLFYCFCAWPFPEAVYSPSPHFRCKRREMQETRSYFSEMFPHFFLLIVNAVGKRHRWDAPVNLKKLPKGKKLTLTSCKHPPFPIPFSTTCFPPPERAIPTQSSQCLLQGAWHRTVCELPRATIPALVPEEQVSQRERDWRVALNSPMYNTPPLFLTVSPAGTKYL